MNLTPEEIKKELEKARDRLKVTKKRRWSPSKLDQYSAEIYAFRESGATLLEISYLLKSRHRMKVNPSTVSRWLKTHGIPKIQGQACQS